MSRKTWLLVTSEVLGLFVNTLTADDKYYCFKRENFQQEFQMHLSQKAKNLASIFIPFLESTSNFQHFGKKCETHSSNFSEILTPKDFDTSMPERFRFRTTFSSRHINESQILLKSDRQHFCPNGLFLGKFTTEFEFCFLWHEYLPAAVSGLRNSPMISDVTKRDVSQLNISQNDESFG